MEEAPLDHACFQHEGTQDQEDPPIGKGMKLSQARWHHHQALWLCASSAQTHTEKIVGMEHNDLTWANLESGPMAPHQNRDMNLVIQCSGAMTEELKECLHKDKDEGIEELCCGLHHLAKLGHCVL